MQRLFTLSISLLVCAHLHGQQVSEETARQVAENFFTEAVSNLRYESEGDGLRLDQTVAYDGIPLYYVFNAEGGNGFVLVAGSFSSYPIVGFSHEGSFNDNVLPPALDGLLSDYGDKLVELEQGKKAVITTYYSTWDRYSAKEFNIDERKATEEPQVKPLISSRWNSGCLYNSQCPEDPEGPCGHVKVGCTAVAMAQFMNYWGYPEHGHDSMAHVLPDTTYIEYVDLTCYESPYGRLCMDFDSQTYQWEQMPDRLYGENESVARLMLQWGIAINMDYGPDVSWGHLGTRQLSLNFDYSDYIYRVERADQDNMYYMHNISLRLIGESTAERFDPQGWAAHARNELDHFRPILAAGAPPSHGDRHAYLVDGYYGPELFHYNWGWGGQSDGYFPIGTEYAYTHILPAPCEKDSILPNSVNNLSYSIEEDTVFVTWDLPEMAADGDLAHKYHLSSDNGYDRITYNQQYRFLWDTIGIYHVEVEALDDCMQASDGNVVLDVVIPDSVNYHPRIRSFTPKYIDTIPVYSGVYKYFEIQASDPNGDELAYTWQVGEDEISTGTVPTLVHDFRALEPGMHTMSTKVSDQELFRQKTWVLNKIYGDLALIDDADSIGLNGKWHERLHMNAIGGKYCWAMQWDYFKQPGAEYFYKPEFSGAYEVSAYIPYMANLSNQVDYLISMDGIPLDTFRISQENAAGKWITLGVVELTSDADVSIKVTNIDHIPSDKYMAIDAIRFQMGTFDVQPPEIVVEDSILPVSGSGEGQFIHFTVTEECKVYLVPEYTEMNLNEIAAACIDSLEAIKDTRVSLSIEELEPGVYWLYAIDSAFNISEPGIFSILGVRTGNSKAQYFNIYPNPTHTELHIEAATPNHYLIEIASINGQVIVNQTMEGTVSKIDLSILQKGFYFITIRSKDFVTTRKIIKL